MTELSICIPTYNCAHYLLDAIGSVMRQGLSDFEIVIVDNASQDDTEAVVRKLQNSNIRFIRNPENIGSRENLNRCLANAQGQYVKLLCADDVLLDGIVLRQLEILRQRPDVVLVTCDLLVTNSELEVKTPLKFFPGHCPGSRITAACLTGFNNYVGGPSNILFRRMDAAGIRFDAGYQWLADLKFGLQLLERGAYVNIDTPGYLYRRHASSDSQTNCVPERVVTEFLRLLDDFGWWNPLSWFHVASLGAEGRRAAGRSWRKSCSPRVALKGLSSLADVLRMRQLRQGLSLSGC